VVPVDEDHVGGAAVDAARHGTNVPLGFEDVDESPPGRGRFGRMFRLPAAKLTNSTEDALVELLLTPGGDFNDSVPAGYTYLGQFIDHDITFDPMSKFGEVNRIKTLVDFRSPRLDLDSLYGAGPRDQPFLYDWSTGRLSGAKLLVGSSAGDGRVVYDLPRNDQGRALAGDGRNDENLVVSQLHLLFIRFHNSVVDLLHHQHAEWGPMTLFEQARHHVRWHYQWIVLHDFLPRVIGRAVLRKAIAERTYYKTPNGPYIPVEFSAAAYRFGHSMVRDTYALNDLGRQVPIFDRGQAGEPDDLQGFRRLPPHLAIDWSRFFDLPGEKGAQSSRTIDTCLADGLGHLPPGFSERSIPELPRLNLKRGKALRLPSGRAVADAMQRKPLTDSQLRLDSLKAGQDAVRREPPLWYYILCEAQSRHGNGGRHLGPVGGQIVAEVLIGLLQADPTSYVNSDERWRPTLPRARDRDFTMPDLIRFTLGDATDPFPARG
jgi:hypothetical protein